MVNKHQNKSIWSLQIYSSRLTIFFLSDKMINIPFGQSTAKVPDIMSSGHPVIQSTCATNELTTLGSTGQLISSHICVLSTLTRIVPSPI